MQRTSVAPELVKSEVKAQALDFIVVAFIIYPLLLTCICPRETEGIWLCGAKRAVPSKLFIWKEVSRFKSLTFGNKARYMLLIKN